MHGNILRGGSVIIATAMAILSLTASIGQAAEPRPALQAHPVVVEKSPQPLTLETIQSLTDRDGAMIRVWVMFTDKGIIERADFNAKAATVTMTERAMKRRAKVGLDHIVFADLPVHRPYVDAVVSLGANHRRSSRWLNAASFEVPPDQIRTIEALSFVSRVTGLATYQRPKADYTEIKLDDIIPLALSADVLDYGMATAQLEQIKVPEAHALGLDGSGVTLAIFDTGFRKSHEAFAQHYSDGRVLAEWDFIFDDGNTANEAADWSSQWRHGTLIWSTAGAYRAGMLVGPAYNANFILCKTEDIRSETQVEEDNWVAALEWVDSLGADVVTSSLSYFGWDDGSSYQFEDMDGLTAVTSIAASMAADMGIVVCNSAGNSGPAPSTLGAPADAHDILTCGAVYSNDVITGFSSRGPTYDGRIKPEVVALGSGTACATESSDNSYGTASGTSLSTPLIAGVACLMIQAHPDFTARMIMQAMMETADSAATPGNDYGWGLINAGAAANWGTNFYADTTFGQTPLTVQFSDSSTLPPLDWSWDFGDGDISADQNPSHEYTTAGAFDVSLTINTVDFGALTNSKRGYVIVLGDTVEFASTSGYPGSDVVMSVNLTNSQELSQIVLPFKYDEDPALVMDSATLGERTSYFERFESVAWDYYNRRYAWELTADDGGGADPLPIGSGEVMRIYFSVDPDASPGTVVVDSALNARTLEVTSEFLTYQPVVVSGTITVDILIRGDVNADLQIDIVDLVYLATFMFQNGPMPVIYELGNVDGDGLLIDIEDLIYLVNYMFHEGPPPPPL